MTTISVHGGFVLVLLRSGFKIGEWKCLADVQACTMSSKYGFKNTKMKREKNPCYTPSISFYFLLPFLLFCFLISSSMMKGKMAFFL